MGVEGPSRRWRLWPSGKAPACGAEDRGFESHHSPFLFIDLFLPSPFCSVFSFLFREIKRGGEEEDPKVRSEIRDGGRTRVNDMNVKCWIIWYCRIGYQDKEPCLHSVGEEGLDGHVSSLIKLQREPDGSPV